MSSEEVTLGLFFLKEEVTSVLVSSLYRLSYARLTVFSPSLPLLSILNRPSYFLFAVPLSWGLGTLLYNCFY